MLVESIIPKQSKIGVAIEDEVTINDDIAEGDADGNDKVGAAAADAAKWILYAGRDYKDAFTDVAKELGMPANLERLSAEEFLAMSNDENLGVTGQHVLY